MTRQAPTTTGSVILTQTSVAGRNVVLEQPYGVPQVNEHAHLAESAFAQVLVNIDRASALACSILQ